MLAAKPQVRLIRRDDRAAILASTKAAGRRRGSTSRLVTRASFAGQGGMYPPDPDALGLPGPRGVRRPMGQRRLIRQPRDLQQLTDVLTGGSAADDPEEFLQLMSAAPRMMERRRVPPLQPQDPAAVGLTDRYKRMQQQQAAAAAEAARQRAQQEAQEEEERRREALRAAMLLNARRHLPRYDAPSLARLASALASAGVSDPALCNDMVQQLTAQQQQAPAQQQQPTVRQQAPRYLVQSQPPSPQGAPEPRSVADLLDAFAAMRHRPSDDQIAELLRLQQQLQEQQQQQQRRAAEMERLRQQQQQQARLPPRAAVPSPQQQQQQPAASTSGTASSLSNMPPEDAARLLYALSRHGYTPDEATLKQLLEQLQPQRLQLQPQGVPSAGAGAAAAQPLQRPPTPREQIEAAQRAAAGGLPYGYQRPGDAAARPQQAASAVSGEEAEEEAEEEEAEEMEEEEEEEAGDQLNYSLQKDAQSVASAVRALERMGRLGEAQQLRNRFMRHVQEAQERAARERRERRRQGAAAAAERERRAAAEAAAAAERERWAAAEAAAAAAAEAHRERERRTAEELRQRRQQRQEEQAQVLRAQLTRKLRTADTWQQIRVLLVTYQEALDVGCVAAAAARLAELLAAVRRTSRGLGLRERGELGDLLDGLGELALRRLEGASATQATSLLTSVVRMRFLEERLLVGLLRRLRDTLDQAGPGELAATLGALAECGMRPSAPWMETFLARCEEQLGAFTPGDLAGLPVCLAQLAAHPGRSWLGSYLDKLQEREAELSQSAVSDAVRAVATLDRQFLTAWRQAAAVRGQQQQQQALQAQQQERARAAAAAQRQEQQQQQRVEQHPQPTNALASVDEALALPELQQRSEDAAAVEASLPPMHSKQRDMSQQAQRDGRTPPEKLPPQQEQREAVREEAPKPSSAGSTRGSDGRLSAMPANNRSIELDVDATDVPYSGGAVSSSAAPSEAAAAASSSSRQLPGSYSVDGYYSPDPYGEFAPLDEDEAYGEEEAEGETGGGAQEGEGEGEEEPVLSDALEGAGLVLDEEVAAEKAEARVRGPHPPAAHERELHPATQQQPDKQQAPQQAQEREATHTHAHERKQQEGGPAQGAQPQTAEGQPRKPSGPKPEDVAQARALRSLLLERYEAVVAFKEELEARQRRQAEAGADGVVSDTAVPLMDAGMDAATARRYLAAREQLQRLQADFDNFRRRATAEKEQAIARAKADVLKPLLAIADNFERAATQIKPKTPGERAIHEAYQEVYAELKELLKQQQLEEIGAEGDLFDPNQHEAVMREERDDVPDGTVTCVFQKGYRLGEFLIRPALVKVASS